jgi:hypothetical protein
MGADIHIYIEWKVGDQPWVHDDGHVEEDGRIKEAADSRNYSLFAKLAGVRGDGPDPKGIPDDVSPKTKIAVSQYGEGGHSHSYESLYDFMRLNRECHLEYCKEENRSPERLSRFFLSNKGSAFYNYRTNDQYFPGIHDTFKYCLIKRKHLRDELRAESILLGNQNINTKVECRLVFFFDN